VGGHRRYPLTSLQSSPTLGPSSKLSHLAGQEELAPSQALPPPVGPAGQPALAA
jgi:hypothetical protein